MSVHYEADRRRFVVRWREDGRQRSKRFRTEQAAVDFDVTSAGRCPTTLTGRSAG